MRNYLIDVARRGAGLARDSSPRPARAPDCSVEFPDATDTVVSEIRLVPGEPAVGSVSATRDERPVQKAAGPIAPDKSSAATRRIRVPPRRQMRSGINTSPLESPVEADGPSGQSSHAAAQSKPTKGRGKSRAEPTAASPERDDDFPGLELESTPAQNAFSPPSRASATRDGILRQKLSGRSSRAGTSSLRQEIQQPVPGLRSSTVSAVSADGRSEMVSTEGEVFALKERDTAVPAPVEASGLVKPQIEPASAAPIPHLVAPVNEREDARIDVRIGRIEVHFAQTGAPEVNPSRPRGFKEHALARRYLDRNWY